MISGIVFNDENKAVIGASVQLLLKDTITFLQYGRTDSIGKWTIKDIQPGIYVLKIFAFGNEPWVESINLLEERNYFFSVKLYPNVQKLKVININAKHLGIINRGDTTIYNIEAFTDSTEYNLKDILNKLPGIKADEGGIKFNSRRVDVVLTEGKDIFASLHKQMMESIKAEDVESIQIIEDYTEGSNQMKKSEKNKVALNVKLSASAKNKLNGDAGINTDIIKRYEANGTVYKTGTHTDFTILLRGNNTAQSIVSGADLLALLDFDDLKNIDNQKLNTVLSLFSQLTGTQKNNDQFAFARLIANRGASFKSKATISVGSFFRQSEGLTVGTFKNENKIFTGFKNIKNPDRFVNLNLQNTLTKDRFLLDLQIPFTYHKVCPEQILLGFLDSTEIQNAFFNNNNFISFKPKFSLGVAIDSIHSVILESEFNVNNNNGKTNVNSYFPLFGLIDSTLLQFVNNNTFISKYIFTFQSKKTRQKTSFSVGIDQSRFNFRVLTLPNPGEAEWNDTSSLTEFSGFALWSLGSNPSRPFRYNGTLKAQRSQRYYELSTNRKIFNLLNGNGGLYYDIDKNRNLYFTAGLNRALSNPVNLFQIKRIKDANTLIMEGVDSNFIFQQIYYNLFYSDKSPTAVYDYSLQLNYSKLVNSVLYQTYVDGGYFIMYSYLAPSANALKANFDATYKINKWNIHFSTSSDYEYTSGYASYNSLLYTLETQRFFSNFSVNFVVLPGLTMSTGLKVNWQQQKMYWLDEREEFLNKTINTSILLKRKNWFVKTNFGLQSQFFKDKKFNNVCIWDIEVEYRFTKPPIRLHILGRNILNLRGHQVFIPAFTYNFVGVEQYTMPSGQILVGVGYVF